MDLLRIIVAILLPPLGVFLQVGLGGAVLDKYSIDAAWLHTGHCPCGVDHRQKIISPTSKADNPCIVCLRYCRHWQAWAPVHQR
jgi:hypothetical protein